MSWLPLAHALAAREDLPVPAWLFAWGASIVLIVSFFALAAAWRTPRFERQHWRAFGAGFSRAAVSLPIQVLCGAVGVFLLGVAIYAGLEGTEAPDRNFAPTFVFYTCWFGFPLFSALLGDLFRPFNPWRAVGRLAGAVFTAIAGQRPAHLAYPERLGRWPAVVGLLAFVWLELVYGASGASPSSGSIPTKRGGRFRSSTPLYTLAMMAALRGRELERAGEAFSVYFGMFARLGAFEVEDGRPRSSPHALAGDQLGIPAGSAALVIACDRHHQLRRGIRGRLQGRDRALFRLVRRHRVGPDHRTAV